MIAQFRQRKYEAKKIVHLIKKYHFCPNVDLLINLPTILDKNEELFFLKIDFVNTSRIYEEEDIVYILQLLFNENKIENLLFTLNSSAISYKVSQSINKLIISSLPFKFLDFNFSMKFATNFQFLKEIFWNMRSMKSLQILKLSLEFNIGLVQHFEIIGKELEYLQLSELYLNIKQTKAIDEFLINLSYNLRNMIFLKRMTIIAKKNEFNFRKDDLTTIFKNLKSIKQLSFLHFDFENNPIQIIDIIYLIRKCLKPVYFPNLEHFYLNANHLRYKGFQNTNFIYYLKRKSGSFLEDTASSPLKSLVLKIKKNELNNESFLVLFSFLKNMLSLSNLKIFLWGNRISFKVYLESVFKINIEKLSFDFFQQEKEFALSIPKIGSNKPLDKIKKFNLKCSFFEMNLFQNLAFFLNLLTNLEELDLTLNTTESIFRQKNWNTLFSRKFQKLRKIKISLIDEKKEANEKYFVSFFNEFKPKSIESLAFIFTAMHNLNLNKIYKQISDSLPNYRILNHFSCLFNSLQKTNINNETRKNLGNTFLQLKNFTYLKIDDEKLNVFFLKKFRFILLAWVMKKDLGIYYLRRQILEEILFYFL